jgi:ABC-type polar amino acid transport system ATPase subunit
MVFQHFNLFPHKTVKENVMEGLTQVKKMSRSEAEKVAEKMLDSVNMLEKKDEYPSMISGDKNRE